MLQGALQPLQAQAGDGVALVGRGELPRQVRRHHLAQHQQAAGRQTGATAGVGLVKKKKKQSKPDETKGNLETNNTTNLDEGVDQFEEGHGDGVGALRTLLAGQRRSHHARNDGRLHQRLHVRQSTETYAAVTHY